MQKKIDHFSAYKKLCQIILASAILGNVSAYAASNSINGKENKIGTEAAAMTTDTGVNRHKEGMAFREEEPAVKDESNQKVVTEKKPIVLFVCGGNTGRSFMGEWYTRFAYGKNITTFSRGSGIDPYDSVTPEEPMKELLFSGKENSKNRLPKLTESQKKRVELHRATPASIIDIANADIVLTMTKSHKDRLLAMIDRECLQSNIDLRNLSTDNSKGESSKEKWENMCKNRARDLDGKIHTLIACATGKDGDVEDGYGKPDDAYPPISNTITQNIDQIMSNTRTVNKQEPRHGFGLTYHPSIYCKM